MDTESARLLALARRCEEAEGHDPILDEDIAITMRRAMGDEDAAPYTASLDAAVSLVPEGWSFWHLSQYTDGPAECSIFPSQSADDHSPVKGDAATAPLALCAAALKARAAVAAPPAAGRETGE